MTEHFNRLFVKLSRLADGRGLESLPSRFRFKRFVGQPKRKKLMKISFEQNKHCLDCLYSEKVLSVTFDAFQIAQQKCVSSVIYIEQACVCV